MNEAKKLYFDKPKFTLNDVIKTQIKIRPVIKDTHERQVPFIVNEIFQNLRNLVEANILDSDRIKKSFYDLDSDVFDKPWNQDLELDLRNFKRRYNQLGYLKFSEIQDLRIIIQLLYEFLEGLKEPAISHKTLESLHNLIQSHIGENKKSTLKSLESKEIFKVRKFLKIFRI